MPAIWLAPIQDAGRLSQSRSQDLVLRYGFQTHRWTLDLGWGELMPDRLYGDQIDYELEQEAQDLSRAQDYIARLSQIYDFFALADKKIAELAPIMPKLGE